MSLNPRFADNFVGSISRLPNRPYSAMTAGLARNTLAAELLQVLSDNSLDLYKVVDWVEVVEGPKGEMLGVLKLPANMKHTFDLQTLITEKLDYFSRTEGDIVNLEPLVLVQVRESADDNG